MKTALIKEILSPLYDLEKKLADPDETIMLSMAIACVESDLSNVLGDILDPD
tara:strand:- start:20 stop:175 length:156 start_codon:yes stop_codon:yes gene_type:complete